MGPACVQCFLLSKLKKNAVCFSFQENDASVRLKIASLLGLLSKTAGFSPDCIVDDAINTLQNESKPQFAGGAWGWGRRV